MKNISGKMIRLMNESSGRHMSYYGVMSDKALKEYEFFDDNVYRAWRMLLNKL